MRSWTICMCIFGLLGVLAADQLKHVIIILRHGARSARADIDPFEHRIKWPMGNDILTASGSRQLYLLGRMMRKYFIEDLKFLHPVYNESTLAVRSSDLDRTTMSAQSFCLGFFLDGLTQFTPEQLRDEAIWTPPLPLTISEQIKRGLNTSALPFNLPVVPIQSYSTPNDHLLSFASCARFYYNRMRYYNSSLFQDQLKRYNETFQTVCQYLHIDCSRAVNRTVWLYVDAILTAEFDGQLPELAQHEDWVAKLERFYTDMEAEEVTFEPFMSQIALNDFSQAIPTYMENAIKAKTAHKMIVLSTHESTMLSYLLALKVKKEGIYDTVPYASQMLLELWKKDGFKDEDEAGYIVNVTFNGIPIMKLMSFPEFRKTLEQLGHLDDTWEKTCALPTLNDLSNTQPGSSSAPSKGGYGPLLAGVVALGILLLFVILARRTVSPKKKKVEEDVPTTSYRSVWVA